MKTIKTLFAAVAIVFSAAPVDAAKLSYLSSPDADALRYFKCAASVGAIRDVLFADGFDVYSSIPATYEKAGRAAVVKASLLAEEHGAAPQVKRVSFTAKSTEKLVLSDVYVHKALASADLGKLSHAKGLSVLDDCVSPSRIDEARGMVDWFDNDVALMDSLK